MDVKYLLDHEAPVPGQPLEVRGLLRIEGESPPDDGSRAPLNVAPVLDRSGSMSGDKLRFAREAAALLVRRLRPEDRVSAVCYDDQVITLAEGAVGDGHSALMEQLLGLTTGGTTNLSGGWLQGRALVESQLVPEGVNRIILMTDGLANVGITDPTQLVELCRAGAKAGITTTTIGFGEDFNEDLLRAMADAGGGAAHYIENPDQAPAIFEEEITGLLGLAAQNVSVIVRPGATVQLAAVRHSYPRDVLDDGGLRIQIGDLYAREPRLLLTEFLLPTMADLKTDVPVARISVEGDVLSPEGGVERRVVDLAVTLDATRGAHAEPEVHRTGVLLDAAKAREDALARQEQGDWEGAAFRMKEAASGLAALGADDALAAREAVDLERMADRLRQREWRAKDVKYMKQQALDSRRARYQRKERYRRDS
jgi:Ca-activated chloride channel family protein